MSLINKSQKLQAQLDEYKKNQSLESVALKMQPVKEFMSLADKELGVLSRQFSVMKAGGMVAANEDVTDAAQRMNSLLLTIKTVAFENFNQVGEYRKLKTLHPQLQVILGSQITTAWQGFCDRLLPELPEGIQEDLADNKKNLAEFNKALAEFKKLTRNIPTVIDVLIDSIETLHQLSEQMEDAKAKLKTNCPEYMKEFFDDVSGGFDLTNLTPEMLIWLQQQGEASRFEVKRISISYY